MLALYKKASTQYWKARLMDVNILYLQILNVLENRIFTGEYAPKTRIPSIRVMSQEFSVAPNTIQRIYRILREEQLLKCDRTRKGYTVTEDQEKIIELRNNKIKNKVHNFMCDLQDIGVEYNKEKEIIAEILGDRFRC